MPAGRRKRPAQPRTGPRVLGYAAQVREGWIAPGGAIVPHVARWTARAALERLALRLQLATGEVPKLYEVVAERECQDRDVAQQRLAGCALVREALHAVPNRALERATAQAKADAEKARAKERARQERLQKAAEAGRAAAKKAAEKKALRDAKKKPAKGSKKPAKGAPPPAKVAPRRETKVARQGDASLPPGAQKILVMPAPWQTRLHAANSTELQGSHVDMQGAWLVGPLAYTDAKGKVARDHQNAWTAAAAAYGTALDAKKAAVYDAKSQAIHRGMVLNAQRALRPAGKGKKPAAVPAWPVAIATTPRNYDNATDGEWPTLFLAPLKGGSTRWAVDAGAAAILAHPKGAEGVLNIYVATSLGLAIFTDAQGRVTGLIGLRRF